MLPALRLCVGKPAGKPFVPPIFSVAPLPTVSVPAPVPVSAKVERSSVTAETVRFVADSVCASVTVPVALFSVNVPKVVVEEPPIV